jgi:hypothetical protein
MSVIKWIEKDVTTCCSPLREKIKGWATLGPGLVGRCTPTILSTEPGARGHLYA